jgi:hypothetical protein
MELSRSITVRGPEQVAMLTAFIENTRFVIPLDVRISEHRDSRSLAQNRLMWQRLAEIAEQVWPEGRQFDAETWNEHAKREFLPEETRKGKRKWRVLPGGERALCMSTSDLDVEEMGIYLTRLEVWAAEHGVEMKA